MYIVEYKNPYSDKMVTKKFKGRQADAEANAFSYGKEMYENYWMRVTIRGYETMSGKKTGRNFTWKGDDKPWF